MPDRVKQRPRGGCILGINAYHGDASAALVIDGQLVAAVEEERFTRVKHTAGFPSHAVRYCLQAGGLNPTDVDNVAIPRDPRARLGHKLRYAIRLPRFALDRARALGRFTSVSSTLASALDIAPEDLTAQIHYVEHHRAHLASSFFVSPFDRAAILSLDGLGDFASGMWGVGEGNRIRSSGSVVFPHSLGMYYTAFSQYLGFPKFGDEYKVMGLAALGEPEYLDEMRRVLRLRNGLGYELDLSFFSHHRQGPSMTWDKGEPVLGQIFSPQLCKSLGPTRHPDEDLTDKHRNVAASMQHRLEEVVYHQWNRLQEQTGQTALAYAGGVAFNCVANGQIFDKTAFEDLYVQSAAGDAGLAIGAAYVVWHEKLNQPRSFVMDHSSWGPSFSPAEVRSVLDQRGLSYQHLDDDTLVQETARRIAAGGVIGWFQGRAEWGPRALGNRSIVADPRRADMQDILNRRIKHRETFRPFAPSILQEYTHEYFEQQYPSPFMLMAYRVRPDKVNRIPAPTHVDGTGRLQTVSREINPRYWALIDAFRKETGVPVLLNTSFNENEPIVNTPDQAVECFLRTRMDGLAIGNFLISKKDLDGAAVA